MPLTEVTPFISKMPLNLSKINETIVKLSNEPPSIHGPSQTWLDRYFLRRRNRPLGFPQTSTSPHEFHALLLRDNKKVKLRSLGQLKQFQTSVVSLGEFKPCNTLTIATRKRIQPDIHTHPYQFVQFAVPARTCQRIACQPR